MLALKKGGDIMITKELLESLILYLQKIHDGSFYFTKIYETLNHFFIVIEDIEIVKILIFQYRRFFL